MEGFPKDDIYDLPDNVNLNGKTVMFRCDGIDFTGVVDEYFLNKETKTGSIALKNIATTDFVINAPEEMFFVKREPPAPTGGGKTRKRKRKRNKTKRKKTKKN